MSELIFCGHTEHDPSCYYCQNYIQMFLSGNKEMGQEPHQSGVEAPGFEASRVHVMENQATPLGGDDYNLDYNFGAPMSPASTESRLSPSAASEATRFVAINTSDNQGAYSHDSTASPDQAGQSLAHDDDDLSQQQQNQRDLMQTPQMPNRVPARRGTRQPKRAPKRAPKYSLAPPKSIYGPPFVNKVITEDMSAAEKAEREAYNKEVSAAQREYKRYKNNKAAKKSRDRKQQAVVDFTSEVEHLKRTLRHSDAERARLAASVARAVAIESQNRHLRHENEALRAQVRDHARGLVGMAGGDEVGYQMNDAFPATALPLRQRHHYQPQQQQQRQQQQQQMLGTDKLQLMANQAWHEVPQPQLHNWGQGIRDINNNNNTHEAVSAGNTGVEQNFSAFEGHHHAY